MSCANQTTSKTDSKSCSRVGEFVVATSVLPSVCGLPSGKMCVCVCVPLAEKCVGASFTHLSTPFLWGRGEFSVGLLHTWLLELCS